MLGTCQALPRVFIYTVTCRTLLCSYRVISGEWCVSFSNDGFAIITIMPWGLAHDMERCWFTQPCSARAMSGTHPSKYLLFWSWLACAWYGMCMVWQVWMFLDKNALKNIGSSRAWHVPGSKVWIKPYCIWGINLWSEGSHWNPARISSMTTSCYWYNDIWKHQDISRLNPHSSRTPFQL